MITPIVVLGLWLSVFQYAAAQTIDQVITTSLRSSHNSDFIQDNNTVLVELDILMSAEEFNEIRQANAAYNRNGSAYQIPEKRKATNYESKRWTGKTIPYSIQAGFRARDRQQIKAAMDSWTRYTCVNFTPRQSQRNYIHIQNGGGCSSYVGMQGTGWQPVTLAYNCRVKSVITHELGHAIGFQHEQTRPDRDNYVTIYPRNIISSMYFNFERYSTQVVNTHSVPYDYASIMHYGQYAFTSNNRPTIVTRDPAWQHKIGNAQGQSFRDLKLANIIYKCSSHCSGKTCPGEGYLDKNCQCQCPGNPITPCTDDGGGGGGGGGGECRNDHARCNEWARRGECGKNPAYMHVYCAKACQRCTDDDDDEGTGETACTDEHQNCGTWAGAGECNANPSWMHQHCKRSCEKCGGGGGAACKDKNDYCSAWATRGYCTHATYRAYMRRDCPKSCNSCTAGGVAASCVDDATNCAAWAQGGECRNNPAYMLTNCRRSCGQC